ncbi:MAG: hypothetical protein ACRD9L_16155, partial [Bryobacteraceae bacterium]
MNRRRFMGVLASAACFRPPAARSAPFPVKFRKQLPYESLYRLVEPGHDEFPGEKEAFEIAAILRHLPETGTLPLTADFAGISPLPVRYTQISADVRRAEYDRTDTRFQHGLTAWLQSLGEIRSARFFVLPDDVIRYEVASGSGETSHYR